MNELLISIITINYNNKKGLEKTIKSVVSQTYNKIKYILIDCGSSVGSEEIIKKYSDNISYWVSEPDNGIYHAMNKGVDKAKGDYLLFLNSGDCLHDEVSIEECLKFFSSGEDLIIGQVYITPSGIIGWKDLKAPITMYDFYEWGPVPHQACFIKRVLFENMRYDESLKIVSDWKFFMQAIVFKECSYKIIKYIVSDFEEGGISSNKYACDLEREYVLKQLLPKSILTDYIRFSRGQNYMEESNYDSFFYELKKYNYKCCRIIYFISVVLVKLISMSKKSLRFSLKYPNKLS